MPENKDREPEDQDAALENMGGAPENMVRNPPNMSRTPRIMGTIHDNKDRAPQTWVTCQKNGPVTGKEGRAPRDRRRQG